MLKANNSWIFALIAIFLIFSHWIGLLNPVLKTVFTVTAPLQKTFYVLGSRVRGVFSEAKGDKIPAEENQKLREEIKSLELKLSRYYEMETELNELRGLFNFSRRSSGRLVLASVVGERTVSSAKTLLLDRGSDQGIQKGMPVVNQDGILVGKIFEAKNNSSLVLILLDRRSRVAATIQNKDKTIGIVEGGFGISSSMKFIPQSEQIETGNIVVTSGLEENIPRGLIIGTVESVIKEVRQPFQEATIKPLVDFKKLITVGVILPGV
ncbi:rod shape-determining protein MreC [Candidatus Uhrbacteria bacterium]|nr:rod shape-determining protein MreC [Candidatus Uhrbacteria bacterium]